MLIIIPKLLFFESGHESKVYLLLNANDTDTNKHVSP